VRAGDHLLAGVAALGERDATKDIEVEHLRDELAARGKRDVRNSDDDIGELPRTERSPGIGGSGWPGLARGRAQTYQSAIGRMAPADDLGVLCLAGALSFTGVRARSSGTAESRHRGGR